MARKLRVFLDTNVALDLLQAREPFVADAIHIFALADAREIELLLSTDSLSTIFYVVDKNENAAIAREAVAKLLDFVTLCSLDEVAVLKGMALDFEDIEDAFICAVAEKHAADVIVTRNSKDFKNAPLLTQTPTEFLATWLAQKSVNNK